MKQCSWNTPVYSHTSPVTLSQHVHLEQHLPALPSTLHAGELP